MGSCHAQGLDRLIRHTEGDAWLALGLMHHLAVLPLSKALSNLRCVHTHVCISTCLCVFACMCGAGCVPASASQYLLLVFMCGFAAAVLCHSLLLRLLAAAVLCHSLLLLLLAAAVLCHALLLRLLAAAVLCHSLLLLLLAAAVLCHSLLR